MADQVCRNLGKNPLNGATGFQRTSYKALFRQKGLCRGVAKLVKTPVLIPGMRRLSGILLPLPNIFCVIAMQPTALGRTMRHVALIFMPDASQAMPMLGMAEEIDKHLGTSLGAADVGRFSHGEVAVEIGQNVRACRRFVVQSTCAPTNDNLMGCWSWSMPSTRIGRAYLRRDFPFRLRPPGSPPAPAAYPSPPKVVAKHAGRPPGLSSACDHGPARRPDRVSWTSPWTTSTLTLCCWVICVRKNF